MIGRSATAALALLVVVLLGACDGSSERVDSVTLARGSLRGTLEKAPEAGATFTSFTSTVFPGRSIFQRRWGGLNFEHVLNGSERHAELNWYTPRTDAHEILAHSDSVAVVSHPSAGSSWGIESRMTYAFTDDAAVDMEFRVRVTEDRFPRGYVAFMWASYMRGAVEPLIRFRGRRGEEAGWQSFGNEPRGGSIPALGAPDLPHDPTRVSLNVTAHPTLRFELPFYYGLVDGDGNPATKDDRMVYLLMFDRARPIRFSMWNRIRPEDGKVDPTTPAWDWQYVIRDPVLNRWYGYRARLAYYPYRDRDEILARYETWRDGLAAWSPGEAGRSE
jgi:hypothetical protein